MIRVTGLIAAILIAAVPARAEVVVEITWLRLEVVMPPVLSNLDPMPEDLGSAGAELGIADNTTTGSFLGHSYRLTMVSVPPGGDITAAAREALARSPLLILDAEAEATLAVADLPEAQGALIIDTATGDARLRSEDCRTNLLHSAPETAMRTDALMQVLKTKRWDDIVMIAGPRPDDQELAATLKQSALKYGMEIAAEKGWTFDTDLRLSASAEVSLFTQDFADYDVLLVADAADDFARYVPDNTWLPRPVAGSAGLMPEAWAPVLEQWGAVQLQDRFETTAMRKMRPRDYAAWVAVRTIGEAVTRTGAADPAQLRAYVLSDAFALDGFKGWPLSYRPWNGQLRQPIAVVNARALVDMAPLDGFLHQFNELDTLGLDRAESACTAFGD
ncbi:ABC transporter substrate-binding protein [Tabrizicola sp.]|uniref:ABC transporter substrate-binding protein n=1 Tax=Tabrizicola sp. TaxID=2005166 RepID=UPI003F2CADCB